MAGNRRSTPAIGLLVFSVFAALPTVASETVSYSYDARGRLIQVSRSGTVNNGITACYTYDRGDNRRNVTSATSDCATFGVSAINVAVPEGSPLSFTVNKVGGTQVPFTVNYATSNGTATAGSDYVAASGILSFAAGQTQKIVDVTSVHDTMVEADETVVFTLSSPSGGATLSDPQATGAILNNDSISFSIGDVTATEGPNVPMTFTVTKSGTTGSSSSVDYIIYFGTATSADFNITVGGTLTFAASETSKIVVVTLKDDSIDEPAETFFVVLSQPSSGTTISKVRGVGTINDND